MSHIDYEELKKEDYYHEYIRSRERIEKKLETCFLEPAPQRRLLEAIRYSLLAGGKRLRPVMQQKFCRAAGGQAKYSIPMACAIEMVHVYSMIHDDLPCMDDDDLRHGKPTLHKAYNDYIALLAGDALQAAAFEMMMQSELEPSILVACARELAHGIGEMGLAGGQYLDMTSKHRRMTLQQLTNIYERKSAALLKSACCMGVLAAGCPVHSEQFVAARSYAAAVGMAFQIRDDILDVTATEEDLGKTTHSDEKNEQTTFVTLFGLEECQRLVEQYTDRAKKVVSNCFEEPGFLIWLADKMAERPL
ncbi:MAG: polyprenyl synthetase family protein [Oscillospiraceae bacterium]|nr:polyprenyl synthetase family protein [Oscillospiraceae bacterium]